MNKVIADKKYHLFLDDDRNPSDVCWIELPLLDWTIVRSYDAFVKIITENGIPTTISFDHDLADEHYQEYHRMMADNQIIKYENLKEKTGYECAKWLVNYCIDNNHSIPIYYLHSKNGIGRLNISSLMESAKKHLKQLNIE